MPVGRQPASNHGVQTPMRGARWIPVLALLLIVCLHQYNVRASFLAPDRGGGFAMFAFVDAEPYRSVHLHVSTAVGPRTVELSGDQAADLGLDGRQLERIRVMPSQVTLQRLAARVVAAQWHPSEGRLIRPSSAGAPVQPDGVAVQTVRIEVHAIAFATETGRLEPVLLASYQASQP